MSKGDIVPQQTAPAAEATRMALVMAALKLFGGQGYDGTSTREIAAAANANIGSIAYHFGSKQGLRLAAADYIVDTIQSVAGQALGSTTLAQPEPATADDAEAQIEAAVERMVGFIVARPEAGEIVQFVLRELSTPTDALDRIYSGVFEPLHRRLCQLWAAATGEEAESERTRITIFMMIGQVVYFRIARAAVVRRMGWPDIGPVEAAKIVGLAKENVAAVIAARKAGKP